MTNDSVVTKIAAGVSAASATTSFLTYAQQVVSIGAGVLAIAAGLFAISNSIRTGGTLNPFQIWRDRKNRKDK